MTLTDLLHEVDHLADDEKLQLVNHILSTLETPPMQPKDTTDWHVFLRETYGSLHDTPIQRWEQGEYEEREPLA